MNRETVLLRSALSSLNDGVSVVDRQGQLLFFNAAARRLFDSRLMKHRPKDWCRVFGLYLPDQKTYFPMSELPLVRALQGEDASAVEIYVLNEKKPSGAWISVSGSPIRDASGQLIGGVAVFQDITDRKKAEQDIVEISGREQRRIGQDLHDGLCQTLLASQFTSRILKEKLRMKQADKALECLNEIQGYLSQSLAQADVIARGLYPVELESHGLLSALIELTRNYSRIYRVNVRWQGPRRLRVSDPVLSTHLYRIAQEAVSNAIKGGKAKEVILRLTQSARATRLMISDNGCGIPSTPVRHGMGLRLMAYRARIISAHLQFRRLKSGGTQVVCTVGGTSK